MAAGASPRTIERARRERGPWERAAAMQNVLDGTFGDPVRIAMGELPVAPPEVVEQLSLLPPEAPEQPSLFEEGARDQRRRLLAHRLVEEARSLAAEHRFLHWQIAFPNVWTDWLSNEPGGGFDAVIGNPPYVRQEALGPIKPALQAGYEAYDGVADLYVYFYELGLKLLRPGGRLSYVVTNKWLRAGYAEALRGVLAERAWIESVVDFGHAKQFFRDADVFPCVIVARRPGEDAPPEAATACVIPRDEVQPTDLVRQVRQLSYPVPRASLGRGAWSLEPPEVAALVRKIREAGMPLAEYAGVMPLYGIKTGFNEAFLIDTPTRDALIAADPSSAEIIKPYLRGQDIERWYAPWNGTWMIFARRGIDIDAYPAIRRHLERFRSQLEPRPANWSDGNWPGRKAGSYAWYEIQDTVAYFEAFERPKIIYNDITWTSQFCIDDGGRYVNNTAYILPTNDPWIAAVLNSPIGWWFSWRTAQHAKDEALRYFNTFIEEYPMPSAPDWQRASAYVAEVRRITQQLVHSRALLQAWYRHEHGIERVGALLDNPFELDEESFITALRKALGRRRNLSAAAIRNIREEHRRTVAPGRTLLAEAARLEAALSDLVNAAYGLTPEEVALMWRTAPPRMPLPAPAGLST